MSGFIPTTGPFCLLFGDRVLSNAHSVERTHYEEQTNDEKANTEIHSHVSRRNSDFHRQQAKQGRELDDWVQGHRRGEVSLNGSPTVSPTTVAACNGVPFSRRSTSTTFLALSQAPPALAMNIAWNRPKAAIEIK